MKMNIGSVSSGYHFISVIAAEKPMVCAFVPHSINADTVATKPITPNTRCPVNIISSMVENIMTAIIS